MARSFVLAVLLISPLSTFAGGEQDDAEKRSAEAAIQQWRKRGPSGIKPLLKVSCAHSSEAMRDAAKGMLAEWGLPALKSLLVALEGAVKAQKLDCVSEWYEAAGHMLCEAGTTQLDGANALGVPTRPAARLEPLLVLLSAELQASPLRSDNALEIIATVAGLEEAAPLSACPNLPAVMEATAPKVAALVDVAAQEPRLRRRLEVLELHGAAAEPAVGALLKHLDQPELREATLAVLGSIGPQAEGVVTKIAALLRTEAGESAAQALGKIGDVEGLAPLIQVTQEALAAGGCQRPRPVADFVEPLGTLGTVGIDEAEQVNDVLLQALSRCPEQEVSILKGLARLGRHANKEKTAPVLLSVFRDDTESVSRRHRYLAALRAIGPSLTAEDLQLAAALELKLKPRAQEISPAQLLPPPNEAH